MTPKPQTKALHGFCELLHHEWILLTEATGHKVVQQNLKDNVENPSTGRWQCNVSRDQNNVALATKHPQYIY